MGAACIDMGGGTTSLAVFQNGSFVHAASVPVGGLHVTQDLARGLSTGLEHAERLKVMHGSALPVPVDDQDMVNIASIAGDVAEAQQQIPRAVMNRIVRARVEETLEMVRDRLVKSGLGSAVGKRIVLTVAQARWRVCRKQRDGFWEEVCVSEGRWVWRAFPKRRRVPPLPRNRPHDLSAGCGVRKQQAENAPDRICPYGDRSHPACRTVD